MGHHQRSGMETQHHVRHTPHHTKPNHTAPHRTTPHHIPQRRTLSAGTSTSSRAPGPLRATRFMGPTVSLKMEGGVADVGKSFMGNVHPSLLTKVMLSTRHTSMPCVTRGSLGAMAASSRSSCVQITRGHTGRRYGHGVKGSAFQTDEGVGRVHGRRGARSSGRHSPEGTAAARSG